MIREALAPVMIPVLVAAMFMSTMSNVASEQPKDLQNQKQEQEQKAKEIERAKEMPGDATIEVMHGEVDRPDGGVEIAIMLNIAGDGHVRNGMRPYRVDVSQIQVHTIKRILRERKEAYMATGVWPSLVVMRNPWGQHYIRFWLPSPGYADIVEMDWIAGVVEVCHELDMEVVLYGPTPWRFNQGSIEDYDIHDFAVAVAGDNSYMSVDRCQLPVRFNNSQSLPPHKIVPIIKPCI